MSSSRAYSPVDYLSQAEQDWLLGCTSLVSLAVFRRLLKMFYEHDLMRGPLGNLLLAFTSSYTIFNVACLLSFFDPFPFSSEGCRWFAFVQLFSLVAAPLYFCMLAVYLRMLASNPFHAGDATRHLHVAALLLATIFAEVFYRSPEVTAVLTKAFENAGHCVLAGETSRCVTCPHVFLYTWATYHFDRVLFMLGIIAGASAAQDLEFALSDRGDVFSDRRKLVLTALRNFMIGIAAYQLAIPSLIIYFKDWLHSPRLCVIAECLAQGLGAAVPASVWLLLVRLYASRFRRAASTQDGALAAALRKQVINLLKDGMIASAENCQGKGSDVDEEYKMEFVTARAPSVFHQIRASCGIEASTFVASVQENVRENLTEGKSGAFMYFTADRRFMIKTATEEEFRLLFDMLPRYREHIEINPETMINPILGAYELQLYKQHLKVIVVQSVFWLGGEGQPSFTPSERFDLKGSWVGRHTEVPNQVGLPFLNPAESKGCKKDMDIHAPLLLHPEEASKLSKQLHADSDFLAECSIMDYSLLLGVRVQPVRVVEEGGARPTGLKHQGVASIEGPTEYCLGIIDVLQGFTWRKWFEYIFLTYARCKGPGVSCVPPAAYAQRFQTNIAKGLIAGAVHESPLRLSRTMVASLGDELNQPLVTSG